jgi:DNA-binding response OmpR family regulator
MTPISITKRYKWRPSNRIEFALLDRAIWREGLTVALSPHMFRIALCLTVAASQGMSLSTDDMIEVLYGDHDDGGPETADNVVSVNVCRLRKRLAPLGMTIQRQRDHYYTMLIEPSVARFRITRPQKRQSPRMVAA